MVREEIQSVNKECGQLGLVATQTKRSFPVVTGVKSAASSHGLWHGFARANPFLLSLPVHLHYCLFGFCSG